MKNPRFILVGIAALALAAVGFVPAHQDTAQKPTISLARAVTTVLPDTRVQTELNLTADQAKEVRDSLEQFGQAQNAAYNKLTGGASEEQADATEKEVDDLA